MTHPKMDAWLGNTKRILVLNREAMISNDDRNDWARYFAKQGIKVIFTNGKLGMGISYAVSFQKHPVHFHFMDRESSRRKRLCGRVTSNNKNMEQPCPSVDTDSIGKENSKVELPKLSVERQQMKKKKKNAGFNLRKSLAWDKIKEEEVVWKAETISEYDSSRNEDNKRNSDQMSDDKEAKEGNRAGEVWREGKTQIRDDGFGKVRKCEKLDKKKSFVVKDTSDRAKENMNQETERRDDSLGNKTQENEKQESYEQERNEEEVVGKAETIDEYGSSRKIHETMDDKEAKEGNRAGAVLREVQTKIGKVREIGEQEKDKKQSLEADTSGKAKENKNQETKSRDNSSRKKTLENEKQESHEQKRNDEREKKNMGLVGKKTNCYINEEDGKEDKEIAEAEVPRKLKGIDKRENQLKWWITPKNWWKRNCT